MWLFYLIVNPVQDLLFCERYKECFGLLCSSDLCSLHDIINVVRQTKMAEMLILQIFRKPHLVLQLCKYSGKILSLSHWDANDPPASSSEGISVAISLSTDPVPTADRSVPAENGVLVTVQLRLWHHQAGVVLRAPVFDAFVLTVKKWKYNE